MHGRREYEDQNYRCSKWSLADSKSVPRPDETEIDELQTFIGHGGVRNQYSVLAWAVLLTQLRGLTT